RDFLRRFHFRVPTNIVAAIRKRKTEDSRMSIEVINDPGLPKSKLPFSPAIKANGFLFVSGQASVDDTGELVSDTFEGEMRRSFDNLRRILKGAGLDFKDVVQVRSYVKNSSDVPRYNEIYREY